MRRPTTLWAASLALLSAPLLMLGDAAPTPQRQYQQNRRYLIPVRRQANDFNNFPNGSGNGGAAAMSSSSSTSFDTFSAAPSTGPEDAAGSGPVYVSTTIPSDPSSTPGSMPSYTPSPGSDPASNSPPSSSTTTASPDNPSPSSSVTTSSGIYLGMAEVLSNPVVSSSATTSGSSPPSTTANPPAQNAAATGGSAPSSASDGGAASQSQASPSSSQPTSSQGAAAMPAVMPANAAEGSAPTGSSGPSASAPGSSGPAPTGSAPASSAQPDSAPTSSTPAGVSPASSGPGSAATGGANAAPLVAAAPDNAANSQTSSVAPPPSVSNTATPAAVAGATGGATGGATSAAPAAPTGSAAGGATGAAPAAPTGSATGGAAVEPAASPQAASGGTVTASAGAATPPPASPPTPTSNLDPAAVVVPQVSQSQGSAGVSPSPGTAPGAPLMTASLQTGAINLPIPTGSASAPALSAGAPLASPAKIPATSGAPPIPTGDPALIPAVNHNSVAVTGTNTETALSIGTSLLIATTIPSAPPDASLASSAPKVIKPADGTPVQEKDEVLCQVGFFKQLNYMFMVENYQAVNQMFAYLPEGLENGINATVRMQSLQPLNTLKTDGFVTCMAYFLCPKSKVNTLALQLHTPNSPLYNNSNPQVATMMKLINPMYPLLVDGSMGSYPSSAATNPAVAPGQPAAGSPFGTDTLSHQEVNRTSSYVAVPVVAGAFMYASAMMIVARRYRQKRRQSHLLENSPIQEPAWMNGRQSMAGNNSRDSQGSGNVSGRSIRSQPISAPVMAQNSLGWN